VHPPPPYIPQPPHSGSCTPGVSLPPSPAPSCYCRLGSRDDSSQDSGFLFQCPPPCRAWAPGASRLCPSSSGKAAAIQLGEVEGQGTGTLPASGATHAFLSGFVHPHLPFPTSCSSFQVHLLREVLSSGQRFPSSAIFIHPSCSVEGGRGVLMKLWPQIWYCPRAQTH
jgi:hypothetical protein